MDAVGSRSVSLPAQTSLGGSCKQPNEPLEKRLSIARPIVYPSGCSPSCTARTVKRGYVAVAHIMCIGIECGTCSVLNPRMGALEQLVVNFRKFCCSLASMSATTSQSHLMTWTC